MILILHYTEASEPKNESSQKINFRAENWHFRDHWISRAKNIYLPKTDFFEPKIENFPYTDVFEPKIGLALRTESIEPKIEFLLRSEIFEPKIEIILRSEVFESKSRFHYVFRLSSQKSLLKDLKPSLLNFQKCGELFIPKFFGWNIFNVTVTTNFFAEFDTKSFQGAEF